MAESVKFSGEHQVPRAGDEGSAPPLQGGSHEVSAVSGSTSGHGQETMAGVSLAYRGYAGFWPRVGALALDVLFLWGLISLVHALEMLLGRTPSFLGDVLLWVGYFVDATPVLGGTLGKLAVGIRIVDERGRKAPFGASLLRETVGKLTSTFFCGLGFLMAAWDDRGQALHDRMARTYVVALSSEDLPRAERRFPRLS